MTADAPEYVEILTVNSPFQEAQIKSFLNAHGIPVEIRGEAIRKTYGITVDGIGAARILVPREFEEAARDLMARAERGELELADGADAV